MDNLVIKIIMVILLCSSLMLTSCESEVSQMRKDIQNNSEQAINYFFENETEKLIKLFSKDIQENRLNETVEEIEALYGYFEEEIISWKYDGEGGEYISKQDGKIDYFNCHPRFIITTNNKTEYVVEFFYNYVWEKMPEREGISKIRIYIREDYSNMKEAGVVYSSEDV